MCVFVICIYLHFLCSVLCYRFVVLCIFIFVCTSVGLLPPGESPIAVSSSSSNNNNNNNLTLTRNRIIFRVVRSVA